MSHTKPLAKLAEAPGADRVKHQLAAMNAIALARANMNRGTCQNSAVSYYAGARNAYGAGDFAAAINESLLSLAVSVGHKHGDYLRATELSLLVPASLAGATRSA